MFLKSTFLTLSPFVQETCTLKEIDISYKKWFRVESSYLKAQRAHNSKNSIYTELGVPTFEKMSSNLAACWIFGMIFHKDFKNVNFINVWHTSRWRGLPTQPTYWLGYRLRGQKFSVDRVCLIKKIRRVHILLAMKN